MKIEFDPAKDKTNIRKHGVSLAMIEHFNFETAKIVPSLKQDYDEERKIAIGYIGTRLYVAIYTWRNNTRRIISLRKANRQERKAYNVI